MPPTLTEMPATFRARLDAALARPTLLDPRAVESVRAAAGFRPRAEYSDDQEQEKKPAPFTRDGDVAIVAIEGPLAQRAWACWAFSGDGYDAIESRVRAALADPAVRSVVLRVDSPGGEVAGCFEAVRAIRSAALAAGKPLIAYADELICSAAYALACACDAIVLPDTGAVGSVGVIATLAEQSEALRAEGINVAVITSGTAKADGHPAVPLSPDARARIQAEIDQLAAVFAGEVATARRMTPAAVLELQAGVFYGQRALDVGLADSLGNFSSAVTLARTRGARNTQRKTMETVLKALGLSADATEAEALSALHARDARLATSDKTIEALTHDLSQANGRAQAAEQRVTAIERDALLVQIKDARKWSASLDGFLATQSTEQLRGWLKDAPALVPEGAITPPSEAPTADAQLPTDLAALVAKATSQGWKALAAPEKHAISKHDSKLAARLQQRKSQ